MLKINIYHFCHLLYCHFNAIEMENNYLFHLVGDDLGERLGTVVAVDDTDENRILFLHFSSSSGLYNRMMVTFLFGALLTSSDVKTAFSAGVTGCSIELFI
jgi:hypothetical protein